MTAEHVVRRRRCGIGGDRPLAEVVDVVQQEHVPRRASFARRWVETARRTAVTSASDVLSLAQVHAVQAPMRGPEGTVELVILASGLSEPVDVTEIDASTLRVLDADVAMTERLAGRVPVADVAQPA